MAKALNEGRITKVSIDRTRAVDTFWDLGFGDSTAIWFAQALPGGTFHIVDYLEDSGKPISHYLIELQKKGYLYGTDWLPHDGVDAIIHNLLELQLIRVVGRSELPGKPWQYGTTQTFLEHFGLRSLDDLPGVEELRRMEAVAEGENCREQALLLAVGELVPPCGGCDSCLRRSRATDWSTQVGMVLQALEARRGRDLRSLAEQLAEGSGLDQERWAWLARRLVQEELLSESDDGSQRLWLRPVAEHYLRDPWPLHWAA
jgi:hypothetical protein